jgi:hypothetical protein
MSQVYNNQKGCSPMINRLKIVIFFSLISSITIILACSDLISTAEKNTYSRSYTGHENDMDSANFVMAYPYTAGTRLDNCQTCHRAGANNGKTGRKRKEIYSPCAHCHLIIWPDNSYTEDVPATYEDTLNSFGLMYMRAGRSAESFNMIAHFDSDGDGYGSETEIEELRFPGNKNSHPGLPLAPYVTFSYEEIKSIKIHQQFMLMNTTKQQYDDYVTYNGIKLKDMLSILNNTGYDISAVTGITAIAPDGYQTQIADMVLVNNPYPNGTFFREPGKNFENKEKHFDCTVYPQQFPSGITHGARIPDELWLMVAFGRDGSAMDPAYIDSANGRLEGEGPFRLVRPQRIPSSPDRGVDKKQKSADDGYNYNYDYDHNAGDCTRGLTVIRLDPVPEGYEEYDISNSMDLILEKRLVVYGQGIR